MPTPKSLSILAAALLPLSQAAAETGNGQPLSAERIAAVADVTVSDGTEFQATTHYEAPLCARYVQQFPDMTMRFETDGENVSVWRNEDQLTRFPPGLATWIRGHQFHAQLFRFGQINRGIVQVLPYSGEGDCPCIELRGNPTTESNEIEGYGLVINSESGRPQRFFVHRNDDAPVSSTFEDWRVQDDREVPYRIIVDDGEATYNFQFSEVEFG